MSENVQSRRAGRKRENGPSGAWERGNVGLNVAKCAARRRAGPRFWGRQAKVANIAICVSPQLAMLGMGDVRPAWERGNGLGA